MLGIGKNGKFGPQPIMIPIISFIKNDKSTFCGVLFYFPSNTAIRTLTGLRFQNVDYHIRNREHLTKGWASIPSSEYYFLIKRVLFV
jgi:hypothetical protein